MTSEERAVPENTTAAAIPPARTGMFDADAMLTEQLRRCHLAAVKCFDFSEEENIYFSTRIEAFKIATKLMKASLELARALRDGGEAETRHRIIYEHSSPPAKNRKTNSGMQATRTHDG